MNPDTHEARALSFGPVAEAYERARPEYPPEAVAWLAGEPPRDVVDLGAGTGKLTRQLVAAGHRVVAVEPLPEMRAELERVVPEARSLAGRGEQIPLADATADVVTVAQAFHWFDQPTALAEIARVLRPGGTLGLVWNMRDYAVEWAARLSETIGAERVDAVEVTATIDATGLYGAVEQVEFQHAQRLDREGLRDLVLSRSYCASRPPAEREAVLSQVEALFDDEARDGEIVLPYVTYCSRAVRL